MTWVESEPPPSAPAFIKASYSGNSLRRAKKPAPEEDWSAAWGGSISRAKASTTNALKLVPRSNARIFAFRYSDSGMSIVVFTAESIGKYGFTSIWISVTNGFRAEPLQLCFHFALQATFQNNSLKWTRGV